jgi:glycosyltransferase involved in cell wall biosynthesis
MFSIVIPSLNNLKYLKLCLNSIKKNSEFDHEIIVHVNKGTDGTKEYLKKNNIKFSYSSYNSGICEGVNKASKLSSKNYILYAHDDFYFCPEWDRVLLDEVRKMPNKLFYLSGTMIEKNHNNSEFGKSIEDFKEKDLLSKFKTLEYYDFQGSTWAPHLIHRDIWNEVGGFSEEFYPGTGSDPDLNKKLWDIGVRVFKGLSNCKVYHFGSVVTRRNDKNSSTKTESGSQGGKIFLLKWGISIKFFRKFYLKSDTKYEGKLNEPKITIKFLIGFISSKFYLYYLKFIKKILNNKNNY